MKKNIFIVIVLSLSFNRLVAQEVIDTAAIKSELSAIYDRDQETRITPGLKEFMPVLDSINLSQVIKLIDKYGKRMKRIII